MHCKFRCLKVPSVSISRNFHTSTNVKQSKPSRIDGLLLHKQVLSDQLQKILEEFKRNVEMHKKFVRHFPQTKTSQIFVNDTLNLDDMAVFGFDYDYTLASYTDKVESFIYDNALKYLVDHLSYPKELLATQFDPNFAIRGIHFHMTKGYLLKIDHLNYIQEDAAYFGRTPLSKEQIEAEFPANAIPKREHHNLRSLSDIYCLPEGCLLANAIQYFVHHNISFDPSNVFSDVMRAKDYVHAGVIHKAITENLPEYLRKHRATGDFLQAIRAHGKKLFLLTNSNWNFVNAGMTYLLDGHVSSDVSHWSQMFDVVITSAGKPSWFSAKRPFRRIDKTTGNISWEPVTAFQKGDVYSGGSLAAFGQISKWKGSELIYFGDHLFNDLIEPSLIEGWKTGVIIDELEREVDIQNSDAFRNMLAELLEVESTIKKCQLIVAPSERFVIDTFMQHRDDIRKELKTMFNPYFGSVFRTHKHATLFTSYLQRYADVYTSKIENFLERRMDFVYYPERSFLPHEVKIPTAEQVQYAFSQFLWEQKGERFPGRPHVEIPIQSQK